MFSFVHILLIKICNCDSVETIHFSRIAQDSVIMFIVGWLVLEGASPVTLNKKLSFKLVVEPASVYTNKQDVPCQAELFQVLKITF
jgi:hypothetical protein